MFLRFLFWSKRLNTFPLRLRGFYRSRVCGKVFRTDDPSQAGGKDYSRHKQKRYMHVRMPAYVTKQPEGLHVAQCVDDENVYGKCRRAHGR